jgi:hypothetical protein
MTANTTTQEPQLTAKDFASNQEVKWCPGCGDYSILKQVQTVFPEFGVPKENIVFHEYTRAEKPKIWTDNPYYSDMDAFDKIRYIIGLDENDSKLKPEMKVDIDKYGLGKIRTLQQYYELTGIDIKNRTVKKNFCREGNIASDEDIKKSNEKNWEENKEQENKKENDSEIIKILKNYYEMIIKIFKNYYEMIMSLKNDKLILLVLIIISVIIAIILGYIIGCKLCRKITK